MNKDRRFFYAIIPIFLFAGILFGQDDELINVDSSIVIMNATITDAQGKPVHGLKQSQFKIFEDGKEQKIELFAAEETPFAAVILLDSSGSMEQRMTLARTAAINFLNGLREVDVAAVYNFDSKVSLVQDFSNSRDIADTAYNLKARGMTVLNDAIFKAAELLAKRPEKRRAIIVLSDGEDTQSSHSSDKALKAAMAANALVYTIDMSADEPGNNRRIVNQGVLRNFAEKTGGVFVPTPGGLALREAFGRIVGELGSQYTLAYEASKIRRDGKWHALEMRVAKGGLSIRTRKGFHAPKD